MVSQCIFYKKHTAKCTPSGNNSKQSRFEETRSNDIEACNQTLSWVLSLDNAPQYSLDQMAESLSRYYGEFEQYKLSPSLERKIVKAAAIMCPIYRKLGIFDIAPLDLQKVLNITVQYMLLNELEVLFFVTSIDRIDNNEVILTMSQKVLESCERGFLFETERIFKKSHGFLLSLMLCFFLAMITKEKLGSQSDVKMFSDVFPHHFSKEILPCYIAFKEANKRLGQYNLIEVNDMSKMLESDEPALSFYFREEVRPLAPTSLLLEGNNYPSKKHQPEENAIRDSFQQGQALDQQVYDIVDAFLD